MTLLSGYDTNQSTETGEREQPEYNGHQESIAREIAKSERLQDQWLSERNTLYTGMRTQVEMFSTSLMREWLAVVHLSRKGGKFS